MTTRSISFVTLAVLLLCSLPAGLASPATADDWPEMQGRGRMNVWNETGIVRKFPASGLKVAWHTPVGGGYAGPAVASGRVFVPDFQKTPTGGAERVVCLDEKTGRVLWTFDNPRAAYNKFAYNSGPRATPTVDGDRVYQLGAAGDLYCLDVRTGAAHWKVNLVTRFHARMPTWGFTAAPIVFDDLLIIPVGGEGDNAIVAVNKLTGKPMWHALPQNGDIGYSAPIIINTGGRPQLIHMHNGTVASLNPRTGSVYWQQPFEANLAVATPVLAGDRLFMSVFYSGPLMLKLGSARPSSEVLWRGKSKSEVNTDGLHALMCSPVIKDGYIYGVCSYGQFRCLKADTGERVWESLDVTGEKARWANAFIVRNRDVYFINNDRGELIIADLSPTGYHELSRTPLIRPTSGGTGARTAKAVNWVIPAYANRHIITRNDEEIISASLAE